MSEDAPRNLFQKLNAIMAEVGKIEKTGRNQSQNYNFIEQSVVMAKLRPMFAEAGVVVIPSITRTTYREIVSAKTGSVTTVAQCDMAFTLINADDPTDRMDNIAWSAEGGDTGDKAVNKAGTSGEKYFLMKLLMLSEKDDPDAETVSGGAATRQRAAAPVRPVRPTAPPARTEATPAGGATAPRPAPTGNTDPWNVHGAVREEVAARQLYEEVMRGLTDDPNVEKAILAKGLAPDTMTVEQLSQTLTTLRDRGLKRAQQALQPPTAATATEQAPDYGPDYDVLYAVISEASDAGELFRRRREVADARDSKRVSNDGYTALMKALNSREAKMGKQPAVVH